MTSHVNPLKLRALRHVALSCGSLDAARAFYTDGWGLEVVEESPERLWLRGTGPEHHIIEFQAASGCGLAQVAFAVATAADVDAAAVRLVESGVDIEFGPQAVEGPGGGYGCGFRDPEGRLVVLSALVETAAPRDRHRPLPRSLSHVVFNTVDLDGALDFWTSVVGLRISDWSEDQMVFLRCNSDHHCVAFNRAEWTSVNHVAFDVADVDSFMISIGRLRQAGHDPLWGPGRHGPGNNAFAYYGDPLGYVPEVTTGLLQVDEASWVPRVWQRVPEQSDLWGTAGPPSPEARERMAGEPDPSSLQRRREGPGA